MRGKLLLLFILIFSIMANADIQGSIIPGVKTFDKAFEKDDCYRLVDLLVKDASKSSELGDFVSKDAEAPKLEDTSSNEALGDLEKQAKGIIDEIKDLPAKKCITGDGSISGVNIVEEKIVDNQPQTVQVQLGGKPIEDLNGNTYGFSTDSTMTISNLGKGSEGNQGSIKIGSSTDMQLTFTVKDLSSGDNGFDKSAFYDIENPIKPKLLAIAPDDSVGTWNFVKDALQDKTVYVRVGTTVAGVRGSNIVFTSDGETTTAKVVHGEMTLTDANGEQTSITDKEQLSVSGEEAVVEEASFTSEELVAAFAIENDDLSNEELKQIVNQAKDEYTIIDPENFDEEVEKVTTDEREQQLEEVKEEQKVIEETKQEENKEVSSSGSSSSFKIGEFEQMKELNNFIERLRNKDKFAIFTLVIVVLIIFWLRR